MQLTQTKVVRPREEHVTQPQKKRKKRDTPLDAMLDKSLSQIFIDILEYDK